MAKYTWETGIYKIHGSSHPVDGPIEKPWTFGCHFTVLPDGSPRNQGQFDANERDMIYALVDAWLQSETVKITASDDAAGSLHIESVG